MPPAPYAALATAVALLVYLWNCVGCSRARQRYGVKAPATTGHPAFERRLRVQQNMVEQLILFLPALWLFAIEVSDRLAGLLGLVFVIGRVLYSLGYAADPEKRGPGFLIGAIATVTLLLGGLVGSLRALI